MTVAELRCRIADHLGDEPAARHWYAPLGGRRPGPGRRLPRLRRRPGGPNCSPAGATGRAALDRARAEPPGAPTAPTSPSGPSPRGCCPWLRAGEPERAAAAHVRAYRRHRRERTAFPYLAAHLRFCALAGHPDRGLDLLAEQLPRLDRPDRRPVGDGVRRRRRAGLRARRRRPGWAAAGAPPRRTRTGPPPSWTWRPSARAARRGHRAGRQLRRAQRHRPPLRPDRRLAGRTAARGGGAPADATARPRDRPTTSRPT